MNLQSQQKHIYYLTFDDEYRNTAGYKAPADIVELCRRAGYTPLRMPRFRGKEGSVGQKLWLLTRANAAWAHNAKLLPEGAVVIFQHPFYGMRLSKHYIQQLKKHKNCKFIAVIHDLESLRRGIQGVKSENRRTNEIADNAFLKEFDVVICHNEHMRQYMTAAGFQPERLVPLELFDYLTEAGCAPPTGADDMSIAVAGYLAPGKSAYLYRIHDEGHNRNLTVHLYGNAFSPEQAGAGLRWHGSFPPEEIPSKLSGRFGLVWDGVSAETCAGNTGAYLRYNNPHKTSLYLAAGLPVIVWSEAAIADFVRARGAGITADSLTNLEEIIRAVPEEEYLQMRGHAAEISRQVRSGAYFKRALDQALHIVEQAE